MPRACWSEVPGALELAFHLKKMVIHIKHVAFNLKLLREVVREKQRSEKRSFSKHRCWCATLGTKKKKAVWETHGEGTTNLHLCSRRVQALHSFATLNDLFRHV